MKNLILILLFPMIFLASCSEKKSILSVKVERDPGHLIVLNQSGFLGATVAGTSIEHVITIKSQGGLSVHNLSATIATSDPISFLGGTFPGTGGTCTEKLPSGDTCTIVLLYAPEDTRSHLATLTFAYTDALSSHSFDYVVSADSHPILSFEYGTRYDFGNKFVGSSTDLRVRISNTGKVVAENITINNLSAPFSFKGGSYPGIGGNCGSRLIQGDTCDLVVNYSPVNNGEHLQDITLTYVNTGRPETNTLNLIAWGFYQAVLSISDPTGHDFGTVPVNTSYEKTFTISHTGGDVDATSLGITNLSAPFSFKGGTYPGTGGTCTTRLSKETGSCTVVLLMRSAVSGVWNNNFTFSYYNGSASITTTRALSAVTRTPPVLSISPAGTVDYGLVKTNTSVTRSFTVTYVSGELPATGVGFQSAFTSYFSHSGGTCTGTLSSGSCTINVTYSPTLFVSSNITNNFRWNSGTATPITFKGITEGNVINSSSSFGNVVNGQTKDMLVNVSTNGGSAVTSLAASGITGPFSFVGGSYPGTGGTCSTTLSGAYFCSLNIRFSSTVDGSHTGKISLSYHNGLETRNAEISLSGNITPAANLSATDADFGSQSVNSVTERTITISNSSSKDAASFALHSMPSGFNIKGGTFPGTGGTCGSIVGSSCTVVIVFNPLSAISYNGNLTFKYDDGTGTTRYVSSTLSGTGINTTDLFLSRFNTVIFPSTYVGEYRDISFTLSHGGSVTPTSITSKTFEPLSDYSIVNDTCPATLSSGASCTFTVRFTPLTQGLKSSALKVYYDNGAVNSATRLISGTGVRPAIISLSAVTHDFGSRPTDDFYLQTFTFTNTGGTSASSMTNLLSGAGFQISSENCGTSLSPGSNCSMTVRFSPTAAQSYSGSVGQRYYNGFQFVDASVSLAGSGNQTAVLSFASSNINFGDIIQTQTETRTITLNHSGPIPATAITVSPLASPFILKGGTCTDTLAGGSCTLIVDFSPSTVGVKNETLTIQYNNGSVSRTITAALRGEALAQAIVGISDANPYHMGVTNLNNTIDKTFTLTNGGGVSATALGGSFDHPAFRFKGGSFPGTGGTCSSTLPAGGSCSIVVSFTPVAAASYSGTLTLTYEDGLRAQTEFKGLQGTGSATLKKDYWTSFFDHKDLYEEVLLDLRDVKKTITEDKKEYIEGYYRLKISDDLNRDGKDEFLSSLHYHDESLLRLSGYVIRCGRTGHILQLYNSL